jgi:hypothetical protein
MDMIEKHRERPPWLRSSKHLNHDDARGRALAMQTKRLRRTFRNGGIDLRDATPGSSMRGLVQLVALGRIPLETLLEHVPAAILERHANDWLFDLRPHNEKDKDERAKALELNEGDAFELKLVLTLLAKLTQREG